jgi:hypothetical protein
MCLGNRNVIGRSGVSRAGNIVLCKGTLQDSILVWPVLLHASGCVLKMENTLRLHKAAQTESVRAAANQRSIMTLTPSFQTRI